MHSEETAHEWFERTFGAPLPFPVLEPLVQVPGRAHWATALAPELAAEALVVPIFPQAPARYTVIGHWGYGIGSQAFYFVCKDEHHRVFLRVGYGGPYDDPVERNAEIVSALSGYRLLREGRSLAASEIVYSIGTGHAHLEIEGREPIAFDAWTATRGIGAPAPRVHEFLGYIAKRVGMNM